MGIPIEFLLERMGISVVVDDIPTHYQISIISRKRNIRAQQQIDKDFLRQYYLVSVYTAQKLNPIVNSISNLLEEMFPQFKKLDIDYSFLEKKYIYP